CEKGPICPSPPAARTKATAATLANTSATALTIEPTWISTNDVRRRVTVRLLSVSAVSSPGRQRPCDPRRRATRSREPSTPPFGCPAKPVRQTGVSLARRGEINLRPLGPPQVDDSLADKRSRRRRTAQATRVDGGGPTFQTPSR